ncbi:hypothetical protein J3E64_000644 [Sphingobium sp. OAS761]|uniref:hypothetical protein n=1 Tax=Sphingobium sp. OAS761 TaxID=2817901 RepID=UPI00209FC722|nr:hypothetical protein [Sphingobium sp. OAS761]MCP1468973.1 hypothetical protein [Sphingobium sp. OAS761]
MIEIRALHGAPLPAEQERLFEPQNMDQIFLAGAAVRVSRRHPRFHVARRIYFSFL